MSDILSLSGVLHPHLSVTQSKPFSFPVFAQDVTQWRVFKGDAASPDPNTRNTITSPESTQLTVAGVNGVIPDDTY